MVPSTPMPWDELDFVYVIFAILRVLPEKCAVGVYAAGVACDGRAHSDIGEVFGWVSEWAKDAVKS